MQKLRKNKEGFTIIEVLIVLAIAGLILLIVFLAVPALQRNSRNSGRRNDIGRIGAGVNDYVANNNGDLFPDSVGGDLLFAQMVNQSGNLAQYTSSDIVSIATGGQGVLGVVDGQPRFRLVVAARCSSGGATEAGTDRQAALQYQLETSEDDQMTNVCQDV